MYGGEICARGRGKREEREGESEKERGRESKHDYECRCFLPPFLADHEFYLQCIYFSVVQAGSCMHIHVPGVSVTECPRCLAGEPVSLSCTSICTVCTTQLLFIL